MCVPCCLPAAGYSQAAPSFSLPPSLPPSSFLSAALSHPPPLFLILRLPPDLAVLSHPFYFTPSLTLSFSFTLLLSLYLPPSWSAFFPCSSPPLSLSLSTSLPPPFSLSSLLPPSLSLCFNGLSCMRACFAHACVCVSLCVRVCLN